MKTITLCADDYALNGPVSAGIDALVAAGRLHAVSCLVDGPRWPVDGRALATPANAGIDIGLHLNFTEALGSATPVRPLSSLIIAAWLRRLDSRELRHAVARQWDRFVSVAGRAPNFVDGHQHVHQFPQLRDALFAELAARAPARPWLRSLQRIGPTPGEGFKVFLLGRLGAGAFTARAHAAGFPVNHAFAGVYGFDPRADYRALMRHWLATSPDGTLLMCHPASATGDAADPIAVARTNEFGYLGSAAFADDCAAAGVRPGRLQSTAEDSDARG